MCIKMKDSPDILAPHLQPQAETVARDHAMCLEFRHSSTKQTTPVMKKRPCNTMWVP